MQDNSKEFYEITDRANSIAKYDFFLKNMRAETTLEKEVKKVLARKKNCRLLDLGCGQAEALKELKEKFGDKATIIGIDLLPVSGLDEFVEGKVPQCVFPQKIDLAFSFRAMHEFSPIEKFFEKLSTCLASGGKAFLSVRCQQLVGSQLLFHGNLKATDLDFMKKIISAKRFKSLMVNGVQIGEKKHVVLLNPVTGSKQAAELEIIHGINFFVEKN